jgi:phosphatidate phosphatase PAH1
VTFSVHSALQGTQVVSSRLFLFEPNTKLVVSDVDGGHF